MINEKSDLEYDGMCDAISHAELAQLEGGAQIGSIQAST